MSTMFMAQCNVCELEDFKFDQLQQLMAALPTRQGSVDHDVIWRIFFGQFDTVTGFKTETDVVKLLDAMDVAHSSNHTAMLKISGFFWHLGPRLCQFVEKNDCLSLDTMFRISHYFLLTAKSPNFFLPEILSKAKKGDFREKVNAERLDGFVNDMLARQKKNKFIFEHQ